MSVISSILSKLGINTKSTSTNKNTTTKKTNVALTAWDEAYIKQNYTPGYWDTDSKYNAYKAKSRTDSAVHNQYEYWKENYHDPDYSSYRFDNSKREYSKDYKSTSDYVKKYQAYKESGESSDYESDTESTKYSRGKIDRLLGMLGYNGLVQGLYYATDDDDSTTFTQGLKEGLHYMNPLTDDVSGRKTFSDILKDNTETFADDPNKTSDNVARFIIGLAGDILLDPLSYVNGIGAAGKILKGTGVTKSEINAIKAASQVADVSKRFEMATSGISANSKITNLTNVTLDDAKDVIRKNEKFLSEDQVTERAVNLLNNYSQRVKGYRDLDQGEGLSFGLSNLVPSINKGKTSSSKVSAVDKMTYSFKNATSEALRKFGDNTVAPYVNSAIKSVRSSNIAKKVSFNNRLLDFAEKHGDKTGLEAFAAKNNLRGVIPSYADENIRFSDIANKISKLTEDGDVDAIDFIKKYERGDFAQALDYEDTVYQIRKTFATSDETLEKVEQNHKDNVDAITILKNKKDEQVFESISHYFNVSKENVDKISSDINISLNNFKLNSTSNKFAQSVSDYDALTSKSILNGYTTSQNEISSIYQKYYDDIESEINIQNNKLNSSEIVSDNSIVELYKSLDNVSTVDGIPYEDILYFNTRESSDVDFARYTATRKMKRGGKTVNNEYYKKQFQSLPIDTQQKYVSNYYQSFIDSMCSSLSTVFKNLDSNNITFSDLTKLNTEERDIFTSMIKDSVNKYGSKITGLSSKYSLTPQSIDNVMVYLWKGIDTFSTDYFKLGTTASTPVYNVGGNVKDTLSFIRTNQSDISEALDTYAASVSNLDKLISKMSSLELYTYSDDIVNLSKNSSEMEIARLFRDNMRLIANREVSVNALTNVQAKGWDGTYIPHILNKDSKSVVDTYKSLELLFGEDSVNPWYFSDDLIEYVKRVFGDTDSGGFNPNVFGNRTKYFQSRRYKTMEECASVCRQRAISSYAKKASVSLDEATNKIDSVVSPEQWYSLYETNLADIFLKRAIDSNKLILDNSVSDFIHFNLCKRTYSINGSGNKNTRTVTCFRDVYDELYSSYSKLLEKTRPESSGAKPTQEEIQNAFEFLPSFKEYKSSFLKEAGINEKMFTANISHFDVTEELADAFKKYTDKDLLMWDMSDDVFNLVNFYTKEQMSVLQSKFINFYDTMLSKWKVFQTVYTPGFHIQNVVSNSFQSFLGAGFNALDPKKLKAAFNVVKNPDLKQTIKLNNKTYTYKEINDIMNNYKVIDNTFFNEDLMEKQPSFFLTKIGSKVGSSIEGIQRANLFMTFIDNGHTYEEAAKGVDKFLFDYGDLTDFEKLTVRRILPFYSFMRKNLPMELEEMLEQPTTYTALNKTFTEISKSGDDEYISENEKQDWFKNYIQLPVSNEDGEPYAISNALPYTQIDRIFNLRKLAGQSSPFIKTPIELVTQKQLYSGTDIGSYNDYLINQLGYYGNLISAQQNKDGNEKTAYILGQSIGFPINNVSKTYDWYGTGFGQQDNSLKSRILEMR